MNPLFRNGSPIPTNPMQRIGQVIQDVRMLQQNPTQLGKYLSDHGMIDQSQMSQIQSMNPAQVGQFLMQNGRMPQQGVQQAMKNIVPTIQKNM